MQVYFIKLFYFVKNLQNNIFQITFVWIETMVPLFGGSNPSVHARSKPIQQLFVSCRPLEINVRNLHLLLNYFHLIIVSSFQLFKF